MFALAPLVLLAVCLVARPLELVPALRDFPFLYVLAPLAGLGHLLDLRLGLSTIRLHTPAVLLVLLAAWGVLDSLAGRGTIGTAGATLAIVLVSFLLIGHGVQTFRGLSTLSSAIVACALWVAGCGLWLKAQPLQCVQYPPGETALETLGQPDGRRCADVRDCQSPGTVASCEHVGAFGMTSVKRRVRYVGILQDPNDAALFVAAAVPLAIGRLRLTRSRGARALAFLAILSAIGLVFASQSRGGLVVLIFVLTLGALQVRGGSGRSGFRGLVMAALIGVPIAALAGQRSDAAASTIKRLGCVQAGIDMLLAAPLSGVGFGQFTAHHDQTAHNSLVLVAAELGLPGALLWVGCLYFTVKRIVLARALCKLEPVAARVGVVWGDAALASVLGLLLGSFFLSFAYHLVLWVLLAFALAYVGAVWSHRPSWRARVSWFDLVAIGAATLGLLGVIAAYVAYRL